MVETKFLKSPLKLLQQDCEFHRQRAIAAQDEVERLHDYIEKLETDKREVITSRDAENIRLRDTICSLEVLNRSLTRQNDILRSRFPSLSTSPGSSGYDVASQSTPAVLLERSTSTRSFDPQSTGEARLDVYTQTKHILWVAIDNLPLNDREPAKIFNDIPHSSTYTKPVLVRRSLPMGIPIHPDSPTHDELVDVSVERIPLPGPLVAPTVSRLRNAGSPVLTRYSPSIIPSDASNIHSIPRRASDRRSSAGASNRKRWIP